MEDEIQFHKIWIEQCEATHEIHDLFGLQRALDYLSGEKLFSFSNRDIWVRQNGYGRRVPIYHGFSRLGVSPGMRKRPAFAASLLWKPRIRRLLLRRGDGVFNSLRHIELCHGLRLDFDRFAS